MKQQGFARQFRLLLVALFAASLTAAAQLAPLPDDPRFDTPVTFRTKSDGESLRAMVQALASAINLTAVVDDVPDTLIVYDIGEPKPFRQVWNLVLTLNNLDYALLENNLVVVGTSASIARLRQPQAAVPGDEPTLQRFYRVTGDVNAIAEFLRQELPGVNVNAFEALNSLSVRGTAAQLAEIEAVLAEIDRAVAAVPLEQRLYTLSNADAAALAEVLQRSGLRAETEVEGAVVRDFEFTVVAEPRTNSLIITAPAALHQQLSSLIAQLDIPQPQVNVQVRIQEIERRTAANLGINLTAGLGNFAATVLDGGLNFVFDAQRAISGLNIGAVLDTLESQGLSRRVDDSTLTMLNNQAGRLQSGGRIELTFPGADGEIQQRTIEFGVIIEVTPRISADGRVILDVNAAVSDLLVPLAEGGIPQRIDFSERRVSSTVTLEPGQTVLLGGLFQNTFGTTVQGVPLLSAIPIIGSLFSTTTTSERNTELLLVVNATVIE
ncbi:MAG: hypothetical protein KGZ60_06980 [Truepera sp.]|nr:hypothetical protein [Truepera sp.]